MSAAGYDVIGDVHGCIDELRELLRALGYRVHKARVTPPPGRQLVFVGDLVDRGPGVAEVLHLVMNAAERGAAQSVMGNHDRRLARSLRGEAVKVSKSLATSIQQLSATPRAFRREAADFLAGLPPRLSLNGGEGGTLVVVHAGDLPYAPAARRDLFNVEGRKTGRLDAHGLEERYDWTTPYRERALVAYGHTPVLVPEVRGRTINLDTGCVYGGRLTALRFPELELVSVPARRAYATGKRWRALTGPREGQPGGQS